MEKKSEKEKRQKKRKKEKKRKHETKENFEIPIYKIIFNLFKIYLKKKEINKN